LRLKSGKAGCGGGERVCGSRGSGHEAGKHGAGDGRGENGRFAGGFHRGHLHGHGAMVRSLAAAAGGQARVVTGLKQASERAEAEKKHQDQGSCATHLTFMLHESRGRTRIEGGTSGTFGDGCGVIYHRE
jgi:hypothetical protein